MNGFYRFGIALCMGWILADGNYLAFVLVSLCWCGVECAEHRLEALESNEQNRQTNRNGPVKGVKPWV